MALSHSLKNELTIAVRDALQSPSDAEREIGVRIKKNRKTHDNLMTVLTDNDLNNNDVVYTPTQIQEIKDNMQIIESFTVTLAGWLLSDLKKLKDRRVKLQKGP